jgi:deoxyribonuclease V
VQLQLAERVVLCPCENLPQSLAGVDVAYPSEYEAVASYVLIDARTAQLQWSAAVRRKIVFPYITSFLGFRELPPLLAAIQQARRAGRLAEALLVDGSGVLHQRHAGIASHLGVLTGLTTVGVTKRLLCGQVDIGGMDWGEARDVVHEGQVVGVALRTTPRSRRPIFVSPGHKCDLRFCQTVVHMMLRGRRLPEPLYWADRLCRQAAK